MHIQVDKFDILNFEGEQKSKGEILTECYDQFEILFDDFQVVEAEDVLLDAHGGHSLAVKILMGDKFFCINLGNYCL